MADEGEDKAAGTTPPAGGEQIAEPSVKHEQTDKREQTEWTASDGRGPLNSADLAKAGEASSVEEPGPEVEGAVPREPVVPHEDATPHEGAVAHAPVGEPRHDHPREQPDGVSTTVERRRAVPVVPVVVALIVGAIIGAGSAAVVNAMGGNDSDTSQVASLGARIDALEKRPDAQPEIDALKSQVSALKSQTSAPKTQAFDPAPLQQKIADQQSELDALKQKSAAGDPQLDSKVAAIGGSVDALKAQGADVKDLGGKVDALSSALDGVKKDGATTRAGLASLQDGQKALEAKITSAPALAVVADSLVEAIAQGKPYASQVAALGPLGADPAKVAVLKENADKGVPSAQALAEKFTPLADAIMAVSAKAPANAGLMDRLKSGMASMVSVRSAGASDGDDVGSRVSRIEADLAHDDIGGAYATWDGLPADAKAKAEAWGALAKTHVEAMDAAHALQQQAIASLGGRKS